MYEEKNSLKPSTVGSDAVVTGLDDRDYKYESNASSEFYDPSKESRATRLGVNFESFKRAPGVTG